MSLLSINYVLLVVFLISSNYVYGLIKLPLCQCECCPGDACEPQLLVYSIDICSEITCSFEQCYKMYPRKCGLLPGITKTFCNLINRTTTTNSPNMTMYRMDNTASFNLLSPIIILLNIFFFFI